MRKFTIFVATVLALFTAPAFAQQLNNPDVGIDENGAINQPGQGLGVVHAQNLSGELETLKIQLPTGLVTVVRNGNHILAATYDTTRGTKKSYNGPFRITNENLVVTLVSGSGGDTGFSLYEVTDASSGAHLFFILVNNVTSEVQIIP